MAIVVDYCRRKRKFLGPRLGWVVRAVGVAVLPLLVHEVWPAFPGELYVEKRAEGMCEVCGAEVDTVDRRYFFGMWSGHRAVVQASDVTKVLDAHGENPAHVHVARQFHQLTTWILVFGQNECGKLPEGLAQPDLAGFLEGLYAGAPRATADAWRKRLLGRGTEDPAVAALVHALPPSGEVPQGPEFVQWWREHEAGMEAEFVGPR